MSKAIPSGGTIWIDASQPLTPHDALLLLRDIKLAILVVRKNFCIHGHKLDDPRKPVKRRNRNACRTCLREKGRRYYLMHRAEKKKASLERYERMRDEAKARRMELLNARPSAN